MEQIIYLLEVQFISVDGNSISANNIASWNGNSWNILGTNSTNNGVGVGGNDYVWALAMNGTNNLFVGGRFTSVDGNLILANNIASWNGNSWNILGTNSSNNGIGDISQEVDTLAMNSTNNLFVGGYFTQNIAGTNTSNIISFNYLQTSIPPTPSASTPTPYPTPSPTSSQPATTVAPSNETSKMNCFAHQIMLYTFFFFFFLL